MGRALGGDPESHMHGDAMQTCRARRIESYLIILQFVAIRSVYACMPSPSFMVPDPYLELFHKFTRFLLVSGPSYCIHFCNTFKINATL